MATPQRPKQKVARKEYVPLLRKPRKFKVMDRVDNAPPAVRMLDQDDGREPLTNRQQETLKLLVEGLTNKQIAQQLNISVKTVDAHRASIMTRLRIHNLAGLVKYAIRTGLTSLE